MLISRNKISKSLYQNESLYRYNIQPFSFKTIRSKHIMLNMSVNCAADTAVSMLTS